MGVVTVFFCGNKAVLKLTSHLPRNWSRRRWHWLALRCCWNSRLALLVDNVETCNPTILELRHLVTMLGYSKVLERVASIPGKQCIGKLWSHVPLDMLPHTNSRIEFLFDEVL